MSETWKPIRSGKYEVSDQGNVRVAKSGRVLKPYSDRDQIYDRVDLYEGDRRTRVMVHTIVAEAFIGPKPKGKEIDHINTNIHDNRLSNLRYVTRRQNRHNVISLFNREVSRIKKAIEYGRPEEEIIEMIRSMERIWKG